MFGPGDDRPTNTKTSKDKTSEILSPQKPKLNNQIFFQSTIRLKTSAVLEK